MPVVNKGGNTVTPGSICYSCIKLETGECPYGNKYGQSTLTFRGDPGTNTCGYYESYPEGTWDTCASGDERMKKTASKMSEAQLNMALYKKIMGLGKDEAKRLFNYWSRVYPPSYADDMTTDYVETIQHDVEDKKTPPKGEFKKRKKKIEKYKDKKLEEKSDNKFYD